MSRLSDHQRRALDLLGETPAEWRGASDVARQLNVAIGGASLTVASLIRRGLVERRVVRGRVQWRKAPGGKR